MASPSVAGLSVSAPALTDASPGSAVHCGSPSTQPFDSLPDVSGVVAPGDVPGDVAGVVGLVDRRSEPQAPSMAIRTSVAKSLRWFMMISLGRYESIHVSTWTAGDVGSVPANSGQRWRAAFV